MRFVEAVVVVAAVLIMALFAGWFYQSSYRTTVTTTVMMSFANADQGKYPNGTSFDSNDLTSDMVLNTALQRAQLEGRVTAGKVRSYLTVESLITGDVARSVDPTGTKPIVVPTQFRISLHQGEPLGLSENEQRALLAGVIEGFRDQYKLSLGYTSPPDPIVPEEALRYDYPLIPAILANQVHLYRDYITLMEQRGPAFRSPSSGYGFADLGRELDRLLANDLDYLQSSIDVNGLTRDRDQRKRRQQYLIETLAFDQSKEQQRSQFLRQLLAELDGRTGLATSLTPGSTNIIQVLIEQDYRNLLVRSALELGGAAQQKAAQIAVYRAEITALDQQAESDPAKLILLEQRLQSDVNEFLSKLRTWVDKARKAQEEYLGNEGMRGVEVIQAPALVIIRTEPPTVVGAYASLGFLLGLAIVLMRRLASPLVLARKQALITRLQGR